jgi:nitrite reductase/ring-hydroxylating ferredoxin subunit
MSQDARSNSEAEVDVRIDDAAREGLTGTASSDVYAPMRDETEITTAPDGAPLATQPPWRKDFPIDWPVDQYVARRDFAKFLVLTSGAFVAGQAWIAAHALVRKRPAGMPRVKIATLGEVPAGSSRVFAYPSHHDRCLLIRPEPAVLLAYSQACTHLSCAVVPRIADGVIHCPCHEGYFDLRTGRNIAGPPPRPLPRIALAIEGDDIYAIGVEERRHLRDRRRGEDGVTWRCSARSRASSV